MDLKACHAGSGGKFRRQPLRSHSAKPYDRLTTAVRAPQGPPTDTGNQGGWLSNLLYPASRFITGSASWLFSSVFRKRQLTPRETITAAPSGSQIQDAVDGRNPIMGLRTSDISEVAHLIKQRTYTRAQADYLAGVIRSRLYEPCRQESEGMNGKVNAPEVRNVAASPAELNEDCVSGRLTKECGLSAVCPIPNPRGRPAMSRLSRPYYFMRNPAATSDSNFGLITSPMAIVNTSSFDNRHGLKRSTSYSRREDGPSERKLIIRY